MAIILFTDALSGNDIAGGSSEGSPKASGTGAVIASGNQTIDLSGDSPNLSTAVSGDTIRISGSIDGIRSTDIFEISAVDDGADTVTIVQTPTSSISGLIWAIGGAFKTIQRIMDTVSAGDKGWIKASAPYEENINQTILGTIFNPIIIEGYSSITGDKGIAINDGVSSPGNGWVTSNKNLYCVYKYLRMTNFTLRGWKGFGSKYAKYIECCFDNNGDEGAAISSVCTFLGCYAYDNVRSGFSFAGNDTHAISCISLNNGIDGFICGKKTVLYNCLSVANSGYGVNSTFDDQQSFINCTIDGRSQTTQVGIYFATESQGRIVCINNIIVGCVSGLVANTDTKENTVSMNNLLFNNTVNYSKFQTFSGEVLDNPLFINPSGLDYSLSNASPALNAGFDLAMNPWIETLGSQINIGALQKISE